MQEKAKCETHPKGRLLTPTVTHTHTHTGVTDTAPAMGGTFQLRSNATGVRKARSRKGRNFPQPLSGVRMVGASCTMKGPRTPARCYPVGCRPQRMEGKGKGCRHVWQCVAWCRQQGQQERAAERRGGAGRGRTRKGRNHPSKVPTGSKEPQML